MFKRASFPLNATFLMLLTSPALAQNAQDLLAQKCVYNLAIQQEIYAMDNTMKYVMSGSGTGNKTSSPFKGKYNPKCDAFVVWNIIKDGKAFKITGYHPRGTLLYTFTKSTAKITSARRK